VQAYDLHDKLVDYRHAWEWQQRRAATVRDGGTDARQAALVLQHPATYTLGTYSSLSNVKFDLEKAPAPLYRTDRGGEVTYHGPGQLVLYTIFDLKEHGHDLHLHLRRLEEVVIRALYDVSGIEGHRVAGLSGAADCNTMLLCGQRWCIHRAQSAVFTEQTAKACRSVDQ
jgi:lipoyl(octanoyl) transferase